MPIAYTVDRVHNIINESWTGTVTAGELRGILAHLSRGSGGHALQADARGSSCDSHIAFTGAELSTLIRRSRGPRSRIERGPPHSWYLLLSPTACRASTRFFRSSTAAIRSSPIGMQRFVAGRAKSRRRQIAPSCSIVVHFSLAPLRQLLFPRREHFGLSFHRQPVDLAVRASRACSFCGRVLCQSSVSFAVTASGRNVRPFAIAFAALRR